MTKSQITAAISRVLGTGANNRPNEVAIKFYAGDLLLALFGEQETYHGAALVSKLGEKLENVLREMPLPEDAYLSILVFGKALPHKAVLYNFPPSLQRDTFVIKRHWC